MRKPNDPLWLCALLPLGGLLAAEPGPPAGRSPDQDLPAHITRLTLFGERADFSHDGKRLLFLDKTFGDVFDAAPGPGRWGCRLPSPAVRLSTSCTSALARPPRPNGPATPPGPQERR